MLCIVYQGMTLSHIYQRSVCKQTVKIKHCKHQASVAKMGAASALHLTRLTEATERVAALEHALAASESASETREREAGDYAAHLEGEMQAAEALTSELKVYTYALDPEV